MANPEIRNRRAHSRTDLARKGPGHKPTWFAVLQCSRPPIEEQHFRVVAEAGDETLIEFQFMAIHYVPEARGALGVIRPASFFNKILPGSYRVTKANKKRSGEHTLMIISRASAEFPSLPLVRQRGLARAAGRAIATLSDGAAADALQWWVAVELAEHGFIDQRALSHAAADFGMKVPAKFSGCMKVEGMYVWDEYLDRQCEELGRLLLKALPKNPFIDRLSLGQTQRWLSINSEAVAGAVLERFAATHSLRPSKTPLGPCFQLGTDKFRAPAPRSEDSETFDHVIAQSENGLGSGRSGLHQTYPSQINVIENMFVAEHLIQAPDGYVFTRRQLEQYVKALSKGRRNPRNAGVREIKDNLQLKRRAAEGLRSWLSGQRGEDEDEFVFIDEAGGGA